MDSTGDVKIMYIRFNKPKKILVAHLSRQIGTYLVSGFDAKTERTRTLNSDYPQRARRHGDLCRFESPLQSRFS